jgi:hypothetical protein
MAWKCPECGHINDDGDDRTHRQAGYLRHTLSYNCQRRPTNVPMSYQLSLSLAPEAGIQTLHYTSYNPAYDDPCAISI